MNRPYHEPVLALEAVNLLMTDASGIYVDATVGGGGHAALVIDRLAPAGILVGLDRDADAIAQSRAVLPGSPLLYQTPFSEISGLANQFPDGVEGVLMDLGISSHQIDTPGRGFSHRFAGPLDLRMDPSHGETAADLLGRLAELDLTRLLREYGEEPQARRIANFIAKARGEAPIRTTDALERVIGNAVPATRVKSLARVFQALRIAVNGELDELEAGLRGAFRLLRIGGRLVVISYHSLEDRIVKQFMASLVSPPLPSIRIPVDLDAGRVARALTKKPVVPGQTEIERNPRSRSAKLRAIEKIKSEE
ncbi:16S rRNA (cytosine(1402)-N(4))-methyltransferase RsmH [candidate division KSB1 bacterium]|nr:16S rRNA (cytosine(1402)-N(4))-methyltransferase RsmH [candidate division KSB1 bacterium]